MFMARNINDVSKKKKNTPSTCMHVCCDFFLYEYPCHTIIVLYDISTCKIQAIFPAMIAPPGFRTHEYKIPKTIHRASYPYKT